ncbi:MAG: AbrB/MazE/SpoVT family DNA-binding domain-containing protein [Firmicutes bacterium]|nr:AbrB/MazE/SpoVT family DNA-binding domain-containing protein [Bacillota bacterium]
MALRMRKTSPSRRTVEATVRKRNQLTLPSEVVDALGVGEGDVVVIELEGHQATLRPVRRSYGGIGKGVYGDADAYVERERADWK